MSVQFIGQGGHSHVLRDICEQFGIKIVEKSIEKVLAFGALTPEKLEERYNQEQAGNIYPCLIHHTAWISDKTSIGRGTQILANAVINSSARIGAFCIINTGAIIEHDARIGDGCHIAPGAIVLGDAKVGKFCFVGAGAIVIQGNVVPDRTFVKAGSVWKS
jgi:UDP-3-O-[3-hydroxymyristoyl] glucosamine N-acyltransferase